MILSNGVEGEHFTRPRGSFAARGFVYVGALDSRFDWAAVRLLATSFPDEKITLYGPNHAAPAELPLNVELPGPADYESLPRLLMESSVGLLPLVHSVLNEGRSPMKLYEYVAAGLPVLASRTSTILAANAKSVVFTYGSDSELTRAAQVALDRGTLTSEETANFIAEVDWRFKANELRAFLESL
ncbi:glycosyltransferase [Agromyces sp. NPDC052230]